MIFYTLILYHRESFLSTLRHIRFRYAGADVTAAERGRGVRGFSGVKNFSQQGIICLT